MENCKKCLLREMAEQDVLESITVRIDKLPENEKTDKELYSQRLNECKNCENLISGVCIKCGGYVEFRAAFKKQKCPDVKNKKW